MFIVNLKSPSCRIREADLEVKVCQKTVWGVQANGRRRLLGSSAFQTLPAAERCQRALLQRLVDDAYTKAMRPQAWKRAEALLITLH